MAAFCEKKGLTAESLRMSVTARPSRRVAISDATAAQKERCVLGRVCRASMSDPQGHFDSESDFISGKEWSVASFGPWLMSFPQEPIRVYVHDRPCAEFLARHKITPCICTSPLTSVSEDRDELSLLPDRNGVCSRKKAFQPRPGHDTCATRIHYRSRARP